LIAGTLPLRSANMDDEPQLFAVDEAAPESDERAARRDNLKWWLALLATMLGGVLLAELRF